MKLEFAYSFPRECGHVAFTNRKSEGELQAPGSFATTVTALTAVELGIKQEHHTLNRKQIQPHCEGTRCWQSGKKATQALTINMAAQCLPAGFSSERDTTHCVGRKRYQGRDYDLQLPVKCRIERRVN